VATCAISATEVNVIPETSVQGRDDSQSNLVKRAQSGDEQAFATLFQEPGLFSVPAHDQGCS